MTDLIENKITTTKDGRYIIHRTIIVNILPADYYRVVLANAIKVEEEELSDEQISRLVKESRKK